LVKTLKFVTLFQQTRADENLNWMDFDVASDDDEVAGSNFNMEYSKVERVGVDVGRDARGGMQGGSDERIGMDLLWSQVESYFGMSETGLGFTSSDLCSSVFDLLCSQRSDAELQAEVGML